MQRLPEADTESLEAQMDDVCAPGLFQKRIYKGTSRYFEDLTHAPSVNVKAHIPHQKHVVRSLYLFEPPSSHESAHLHADSSPQDSETFHIYTMEHGKTFVEWRSFECRFLASDRGCQKGTRYPGIPLEPYNPRYLAGEQNRNASSNTSFLNVP